MKLISNSDDWVESCKPNPCQYDGKCISSKNGQRCQCKGHFTGRFCGLTMCQLDPCVYGQCELTNSTFKVIVKNDWIVLKKINIFFFLLSSHLHKKCHCQTGYLGLVCDQKQKLCNDNPCEGRGECVDKDGGFHCRY